MEHVKSIFWCKIRSHSLLVNAMKFSRFVFSVASHLLHDHGFIYRKFRFAIEIINSFHKRSLETQSKIFLHFIFSYWFSWCLLLSIYLSQKCYTNLCQYIVFCYIYICRIYITIYHFYITLCRESIFRWIQNGKEFIAENQSKLKLSL